MAKSLVPVPENREDSSSEEESESEEDNTSETEPKDSPKPMKPKRHMKTPEEFTKLYGFWKSTQKLGHIRATDSLSNEETRTGDNATYLSKA